MNEQEIIRICGERGLALRGVVRNDEMVQLVPDSLDALPDAETLREIAQLLAESGDARWVTLLLEDP